jgi:hypothetical protein
VVVRQAVEQFRLYTGVVPSGELVERAASAARAESGDQTVMSK